MKDFIYGLTAGKDQLEPWTVKMAAIHMNFEIAASHSALPIMGWQPAQRTVSRIILQDHSFRFPRPISSTRSVILLIYFFGKIDLGVIVT